MLHCLATDSDLQLLDREPFKFNHDLQGHPALSLENLGRVLPALPNAQVYHSKGTRDTEADLDRLHQNRPNGMSIEETIENIRHSDSYIMVRSPESHPSFTTLHNELLNDVEKIIRKCGNGIRARESMLYLFIASPLNVTPFHIDRYSTLLMQIRGNKTVTIYPAWDRRVANPQECEDYLAYASQRGPRRLEGADACRTSFTFSPGEALHIPFAAGHHVQNGPDDVSISMSIIFKTDVTERIRRAAMFNRKARQIFSRVGFQPSPVGRLPWIDAAKSVLHSGSQQVKGLFRKP